MVGKEQNLFVAIVVIAGDIVVGVAEPEGSGILQCLYGYIVGFLEVPGSVVSVRVGAVALGIGRYLLGVLQPPCIGEVGLCQELACHGFAGGTGCSRLVGQVGHSLQQVGEDSLGVDLRHRVAYRRTRRCGVEGQLTSAKVQGHATESAHEVEVVEGAEEVSLGNLAFGNIAGCSILDDAVNRIDKGERVVPQHIAAAAGRSKRTGAREVGILEVAVGRLSVGVLVGACLVDVQEIAVAIDIAQVGIERSQAALNALVGLEETGLIDGTWLLVEHVGAGGEGYRCRATYQACHEYLIYRFHIVTWFVEINGSLMGCDGVATY